MTHTTKRVSWRNVKANVGAMRCLGPAPGSSWPTCEETGGWPETWCAVCVAKLALAKITAGSRAKQKPKPRLVKP